MSKSNEENQTVDTNETPVVVVRDANLVLGELKVKVGRIARQEAKAVESDKLAATFNAEIIEMATGAKPQTASRSIATISAEQVKHVKRAAKTRETNANLAGEIREAQTELTGMLTDLLTPYPLAEEAEEAEGSETDGQEQDGQDTDTNEAQED